MMKPPPSAPAGPPLRDCYARPSVDVASHSCGQSHWRAKGKPWRIAYGTRRCADDRSHAGVATCVRRTEVGLSNLVLPEELNAKPDLGCGGRSTRYPLAPLKDNGDDC